jgi:hypothetical protein
MHMFVGTLRRGKNIDGYIAKGLVVTGNIRARHDELAAEITRRGYRHRSPLVFRPPFSRGRVDVKKNLRELSRRCAECATLIRARNVARLKAELIRGQE